MTGSGMALSAAYTAAKYEVELAKQLNPREMHSQPNSDYYKREDRHLTILVGY